MRERDYNAKLKRYPYYWHVNHILEITTHTLHDFCCVDSFFASFSFIFDIYMQSALNENFFFFVTK